MRAIILMFDSLNRHMLSPYAETFVHAPNFARLASRATTFDNFYAGSMPCMPARREMHTGRYNFLHRSWGPLEPFDDSMPEILGRQGIHTHLVSDHPHYWEDGGATYHTRYTTWEFFRGQEGDPWKGVVSNEVDQPGFAGFKKRLTRQDAVNRSYMATEDQHSQTRTVDAGLEFIRTNAGADRWMLQLELFDPHEPFFTHSKYKDLYPHEYDGPEFDWPGYQKVSEPDAQVEHARREYAALVSMCDASLGRVLDAMDEHDLWDDTLLIVNTDHGFLLGEHGWWAKSVQPWFNELVHLPMFLWDPRTRGRDDRRGALAQTIDIAPTVLRWFGIEPTPDMQGHDLADVLVVDEEVREAALFGIHGAHVNVTDGRYVYMRASKEQANGPLEDFTLMPTHMKSRFSVEELAAWQPAAPFAFTKGLRTMRVPASGMWMNPWQYGSLLFDLVEDPEQNAPIVDDDVELRMLQLLRAEMLGNDAPDSQFERLGIPRDGELGAEHLLVRQQRERAIASAEPLPSASQLDAVDLLNLPIHELMQLAGPRDILAESAAGLVQSEQLSMATGMTLLDLARLGIIPAGMLRRLDTALAPYSTPVTASTA
jgi:arylsulfatase A-like enzyme